MDPPLKLVGAPGSPYSRKLRAVLRYRRIPHHWIVRSSPSDRDIPPVPVSLIPVLVYPGEDGAHERAEIDTAVSAVQVGLIAVALVVFQMPPLTEPM